MHCECVGSQLWAHVPGPHAQLLPPQPVSTCWELEPYRLGQAAAGAARCCLGKPINAYTDGAPLNLSIVELGTRRQCIIL
jgi:hypothetical protein